VRDFTLVTFGGSGSLVLCPLIDILGIREVLVPPNPGNVSAFGLLTVDVRIDHVRTAVSRHDALDYAAIQEIFSDLEARARQRLASQGFEVGSQRLIRTADLRYFGQAFEVRVPVPGGHDGADESACPVDATVAETVRSAFHDAHRALYGYDFRGEVRQPVEWVNLRVTGVGPIRRPALPRLAPGDGNPGRARTGSRPVCFGRRQEFAAADIYARARLAAGDVVCGPAVIEEYGATVPLHPDFTAKIDGFGNLRVRAAHRGI
jgi:N-methylhydantoinase A